MATRRRRRVRRVVRRRLLGGASGWCVKSGKRTLSCHRLKRVAKKAARRSGGRVVKRG
jgi:hypothetical protein